MAVTLHHYSLPLRSIVKQGYSPSVQTPDPVESPTLWLPGELRVYSLSSWDPTSLLTQVPTSLLPSLPAHQKIHTHTNIIFSPFDVYFNGSHQFTMLVWESVFSWLAISKKADLWRHNSKLSDLFYSVTGWPACTSPGSLSGVAEGTFSFDSASFFDSASYFGTLFDIDSVSYMHRNRKKKQFGFLVFFTFFNWVAYDRIFLIKVPFRGLLILMVIFRALKDKRRVLVLRKGNNFWVGREISWKGIWADEGFCGRQGRCRDLGQQIQ